MIWLAALWAIVTAGFIYIYRRARLPHSNEILKRYEGPKVVPGTPPDPQDTEPDVSEAA